VLTRVALVAVLAVTSALAGRAYAAEQQVPPMLVFARGGDIYRLAVDGSETVRLTATKAVESDPAVSANALSIAFVRGRDGLWAMDTQGGNQRTVVASRTRSVPYASTNSPSWTPDGVSIVFGRVRDTPHEFCGSIFRVRASGGTPRRLTAGVAKGWLDTSPAVSPDGARIAITSGDCEPSCCLELTVISSAGRPTRDLRRLRSTPGVDRAPAWSPDGERLAFAVYDVDGSGRSALHVVDRDGSHLRRITSWALDLGDPAWSPDGNSIAFDKRTGLFLVRPDGSELTRVAGTRAGDTDPAWLPRT